MQEIYSDVVALTGGIASGKTTTAALFAELGASVVSADELAREVVEPGTPGLEKIAVAFGPDVIDGTGALDRRKLAEVIFSDPAARRRLEAITHPEIRRSALEGFAAARARSEALIVYDCPLLYEVKLHEKEWRAIVVVTAPEALTVNRLTKRNGLSLAAAEERLAAQLPLSEKVKLADYVIDNGGTLEELREQVAKIYQLILSERPITQPGRAAGEMPSRR